MKGSEKTRRVRNCEPPEPVQHVGRDDWYLGFACALAEIWRLHHDGSMIRHLLSKSGISIKHLEDAGVDEFDLAAIQNAMARRGAST